MAPALIVAAVFAQAAIDNPAALDVPAAAHARAVALVAQLGDRQYTERDAAYRALEAMGRLALPAVREGKRSADAEVRVKCERLLPPMETDELAARLSVFVADAAGRYDHRVPGWELFRAAAGDSKPARDLFAEIVRNRDNWPLLAALRGPGVDIRAGLLAAAGGVGAWADRPPPLRAAQAGAARRWDFLVAQEAPPPVGADDDAPPAHKPQPTVPEVALVILSETLHSERQLIGGRMLSKDYVNAFFNRKPGRDALEGKGKYGLGFVGLGRTWLETRDGPGLQHAFILAYRIELDPATVVRYAARVVPFRAAVSDVRAEAAAKLAQLKASDRLGVLLGEFADPESVGGGLLRDHFLAAAIDLTGQDRADYHLGLGGSAGLIRIPDDTDPKDVAKVVAERREAAFARWREWEATRFGAVVGPAVVVGVRPGQ